VHDFFFSPSLIKKHFFSELCLSGSESWTFFPTPFHFSLSLSLPIFFFMMKRIVGFGFVELLGRFWVFEVPSLEIQHFFLFFFLLVLFRNLVGNNEIGTSKERKKKTTGKKGGHDLKLSFVMVLFFLKFFLGSVCVVMLFVIKRGSMANERKLCAGVLCL